MKNVLFAVMLVCFLILCGCGGADRSAANASLPETSEPRGTGGGGGREDIAQDSYQAASLEETVQDVSNSRPDSRMIVKNAKIKIEHSEPDVTIASISDLAVKNGGYVVESKRATSSANTRASDVVNITLRVPADKFDATISEIKRTGGRLIDETIKGEDVTEQFVDIEARLLAQKNLEQQLMEIMKRATKVDEALNVQKELGEVRTEIERIEGRRRYLQNQAAMSTIELEFRTPLAITDSSQGFFSKLKTAVSDGVRFALDFILGLVSFIIGVAPFLLIIVLPISLFIRYLFKRKKNPVTDEVTPDESE